MATRERPHNKPEEKKTPPPAPVDPNDESVAGEEDPGAALEDSGEDAFSKPATPR